MAEIFCVPIQLFTNIFLGYYATDQSVKEFVVFSLTRFVYFLGQSSHICLLMSIPSSNTITGAVYVDKDSDLLFPKVLC